MPGFKVCAVTAFVTSLSATAAMAAATQVNITDPNTANRGAHVEVGGRLAVQEVEPASFFHSAAVGIIGCTHVAVPVSGKALVVREIRVNSISTSGFIAFYADATCTSGDLVAEVDLPITGHGGYTVTFDPGIAISSGGALSAIPSGGGDVSGNIYVDGYSVSASAAPVVGQTIQVRGSLKQPG